LIVKPISLIVLGINIRNRERLPLKGPAILVANHNSHLDTFVLVSLFPLSRLHHIRPVAAADYFCRGPVMTWISKNIFGVIPIARKKETRLEGSEAEDPMQPVYDALQRGSIVIFYPEGTRGEPERLAKFKSGIAYLSKKFPEVPIVPCFLHGLGKALPKGEAILVPFFCDIFVGEPIRWNGEKERFMNSLESSFNELTSQLKLPAWD